MTATTTSVVVIGHRPSGVGAPAREASTPPRQPAPRGAAKPRPTSGDRASSNASDPIYQLLGMAADEAGHRRAQSRPAFVHQATLLVWPFRDYATPAEFARQIRAMADALEVRTAQLTAGRLRIEVDYADLAQLVSHLIDLPGLPHARMRIESLRPDLIELVILS